MQVNLKILIDSVRSLGELANQPLRASVAFKLKRVIKVVEAEIKTYDETRIALCQKYGTINDEAGNYDIRDESLADFTTEMAELQAQEVSIDTEKLTLFDLGDAQISTSSVLMLDWLIDDGETRSSEPKASAQAG